jgi:NADH-quinone oxidoreductase subunit M
VSWLLPLVLAVPLAGSALLTVLPRRTADRTAAWLGVVISAVTFGVVLVAAGTFDRTRPQQVQLETDLPWVPAFGMRFHLGVDGVSLPFVVLTALLVLCCCVYTVRVRPVAGRVKSLTALVLLLEVGMLGTFTALDLLLFFLSFEIVLVPMWFVIAWWGEPQDRPGRTAAATTFILYTLAGSALMLAGFLLVGAKAGTLDLVELAARSGEGLTPRVQLLAALAIVGGLAVKVPLWPLHTWLPDAHAKAPTVGSVLLAGVLLKMGSYGLVRVALPVVPDGVAQIAPWLAGLAVVGIVYGSLACLAQSDLKRLVAYSSVGHMGFVVLGVATLTPAGVNGSIYAGLAHGIITGLLFFLAGAVKDRHGTTDMAALGGGLYARLPRLGALLAFACVASLGLPGLAGFWGEMLSLAGAFRPSEALQRPYSLVLMGVAGIGAVLTAAYLLMVVRRVCQGRDEIGARLPVLGDVTVHEVTAWSPLVALTLLLGVWPGLVLAVTDPAVQALLGGGG